MVVMVDGHHPINQSINQSSPGQLLQQEKWDTLVADWIITTGVGFLCFQMWDSGIDSAGRNEGWRWEHVSEIAAHREELEESRDSRVPGFGTEDAISYFLSVRFLFGCFIECNFFNSSVVPDQAMS
jgi:hypothetical protein